MGQFDVHRNKGASKEDIPFVVVVQSSLFDGYGRRLVVPLVRRHALPKQSSIHGSRLNPVFKIKGVDVALHPLDMVAVARGDLGEVAGSLSDRGQDITDALDELFTRSWG